MDHSKDNEGDTGKLDPRRNFGKLQNLNIIVQLYDG